MTTPDANPDSPPASPIRRADAENRERSPSIADLDHHGLRDRRLGDFRLLRRLGRGGMAEVYLAEQTSMGRQVALKVLRPELVADETHLKRFTQEARTAGGLNHANIVQVYTIGEAEGIHYIAQEYVQGINLAQYLQRKGPPEFRVALHIIRQTAHALKAAGDAKIIHRDIKPENILITRKGAVKVTDFGLARLTLSERVNLTQDGITMGTPLYMSPEQINGRELDARTDIYSLGVTSYHLLAGRPPFRGETAMSLAVQHVNERPAPLDRIRPDLPSGLCRIIERMMAKSSDERYADAGALLEDLRRLSTANGDEPSTNTLTRLGRFISGGSPHDGTTWEVFFRRPLHQQAILVATACLLVAGIAAAIGWMMRPPDPRSAQTDRINSEVRADTVSDQYLRTMKLENDEDAWLAVEDYFPHETHYVNFARAELARLYLQNGRLDEAEPLFAKFATSEQSDPILRARGYAGLAIIACARQDFAKSNRIISVDLQPLQEHLDDKSRTLVLEAILRNRAELGEQAVDRNLEERFPPPPERAQPNS